MSNATVTLYDTRQMLNVLEYIKQPFSFVLDTFFTESDFSFAETVEFDIIRQKRKMAPFVHPMKEGKIVGREGYTTRTFKPAYVKPKRLSSAADFLKRQPGENPYAPTSIAQRAAALMTRDLSEMSEYILRREEWMAVQALTTGTIPVVGDGVSYTVDLLWSATHTIINTGLTANGWGTSTTADPLKDLDAAAKIIAQDAGVSANLVVMGETAWNDFIAADKIQDELKKFNSSIGQVKREPFRSGAIYRGSLGGYDFWTYHEWYIDPADDTEKELFPTKGCLLGSTAARCVRHYGAIQDLDAPGGAPVRAFPKSWREPDPSGQVVLLQSAPLPAVHEVDAFVMMTVVA